VTPAHVLVLRKRGGTPRAGPGMPLNGDVADAEALLNTRGNREHAGGSRMRGGRARLKRALVSCIVGARNRFRSVGHWRC